MQKTEKFFIFSWKELTVIGLLFVISIGFFFTLGLHYGKNLHPEAAAPEVAGKLEESPENLPSKQTLEQASQHAPAAADESIKEATKAEVQDSGIKTDVAHSVDLPKEKVAAPAPAAETAAPAPAADTAEEAAPAEEPAKGKFAVQLGSYPNKMEAQLKIKTLVKRGLHPEIRTAEVNGQTRFRVVLPGFKTKAIAVQKANELKHKRKIENYVVIKGE
jgi:cell division protein FtsN